MGGGGIKLTPTFTFNYQNNNHQFSIGNLYARNNRHLIEPIMASEKILNGISIKNKEILENKIGRKILIPSIIETGFEYKYHSDKFLFNTWLNWENFILKKDNFRERFTAGFILKYTILHTKNHKIDIPFNSLFFHRGGQINKATNLGVLNMNNTCTGITYQRVVNDDTKLRFSGYFMTSNISNLKEEFPFKKGSAYYITSTFDNKHFEVSLSYFSGNKFSSPKGNDMFQSYSRRIDRKNDNALYTDYNEPQRNLIFLKGIYKYQFEKNVLFGVQAEGFYQLNSSKTTKNYLDYSYSIHVIFNDIFNL